MARLTQTTLMSLTMAYPIAFGVAEMFRLLIGD